MLQGRVIAKILVLFSLTTRSYGDNPSAELTYMHSFLARDYLVACCFPQSCADEEGELCGS